MADDKPGILANARKRITDAIKRPRASWPLTADGKRIATDALQDKTREQIQDIISNTLADPESAAALKLSPSAAAALAPPGDGEHALDDDTIGFVLDGLALIQMKIAQRRGYSELQTQILQTSAERKSKLLPRLHRIADKRLPKGVLGKWEDEILAITIYTSGQVELWKKMQEQPPANKPAPKPADVVSFPPAS
jgi:hypothetical protein